MLSKTLRKPRSAIALLLAILSTFSMVSANAMGTGNPYLDAQSGLNYVVYQPSYVAGLVLSSHTLVPSCHQGSDESFSAVYGTGKKFFTLSETSSKSICAMNMMLVRGATRTVVNKPGAGTLTGTQVVIISVGVPRSELNKVLASLKAKYKA